VKSGAEAVGGTVRAGKAITDVVIGKVETTGETKESSDKVVKKEHKGTTKHRNKGECKVCTHQMDAPYFNRAWPRAS